jgi:hypothetical protein
MPDTLAESISAVGCVMVAEAVAVPEPPEPVTVTV